MHGEIEKTNISMKHTPILFLFICLIGFSCQSNKPAKPDDGIAREYYADGVIKKETEVKDTLAHGLMKQYDRDGGLMSVYTFNMGKLHGPAVSYYPNKNIEQKMYYTNGKRTGTTLWYYDTGELFRSIPYVDGKIEGIKISYYKNGKVMSEAPFHENLPGLGLKEYNDDGKLINDDTKIVIEEENRLFADNTYNLIISLSKPKNGVKFFEGELVSGKYIGENQTAINSNDGVAIYPFKVHKGGFRMETIIFSASYKTSKSNYRVISRSYNLAIDNK